MDSYFVCLVILVITYGMYRYRFETKSKCITCIHQGIYTKIAVTAKQCIDLLTELEAYQPSIVGLDIEWCSESAHNSSSKASLLQIGHKNLIVLIRLHLMHDIPGKLHDFLGNVEILKAGVGIYDDKKKLYHDYALAVNGCIDINHIFNNKLSITQQNELRSSFYNKEVHELSKQDINNTLGLNSMTRMLLKQAMEYKHKSSDYQFHNQWNDDILSIDHIHYAADDALVAYQLFITLMNATKNNDINISYLTSCYGLIDIKKGKIKRTKKLASRLKRKQKLLIAAYMKQIAQCLTYINVPQNDLLDVTNLVAEYYPKKKQYRTLSQNAKCGTSQVHYCGCCGKKDKLFNLPKYHILPQQYIKYINMNKKNKKDHFAPANNVILTCKSCKKLCDKNGDAFRQYLCKTYNVSCIHTRRMFIRARTAASGFIDANVRYKLPIKYQMELLQNLCIYYNLSYEVVYDINTGNECEEYKWQWYDNSAKAFVDYTDYLSNQIESEYIAKKEITSFKIEIAAKNVVNEYKVDFNSMEQRNMKSKYKRGMRRIYKNNSKYLMQYDLNRFDHLIKIRFENKCCDIHLTTNDVILCCIEDIMKNGQKSVSSLQREQFTAHAKQIFNVIKNTNAFAMLWKENFIKTMKPKHYNNET